MKTETIQKAIESLEPIKYEPNYIGYFVLKNGNDLGGSDYCKKCIAGAVKVARQYHKEQRINIIKKYKKISESGKYTLSDISKAKRYELKDYPAKSFFTYEGHDPDFGGGCNSPNTCEGCGKAFQTGFVADKEEAQHLMIAVMAGELSERDKWELEIALRHYQYSNPDAQKILMRIAKKILT